MVVALASRAITLLSSLLEELQVEGLITDFEDERVPVEVDNKFSINVSCCAWTRVKKLMDDLPLLKFVVAQFTTLYKMVGLFSCILAQHVCCCFWNAISAVYCCIIFYCSSSWNKCHVVNL